MLDQNILDSVSFNDLTPEHGEGNIVETNPIEEYMELIKKNPKEWSVLDCFYMAFLEEDSKVKQFKQLIK